MSSVWRTWQLGDILTLKRGYDLPKHQRIFGTVPIISSSGISDFHNEAKVKGPGVVTGRYGTIGKVFYIEKDFWPLNTSLYVQDFKGNDPRFVSYFLRTLNFGMQNVAGAVPGVNRNFLHLLPVKIPLFPIQQKIASILSAYDNLIENNLRRIQILEEMAQNLYREWFVKFRFPGHEKVRMVDSELGKIPSGWDVKPLRNIVTLCRKGVKPQSFPDEPFEHFSFPAYDSGKLPKIENGHSIKSGKYEVPQNCVLVPKLNPHIPRVWLPKPDKRLRSVASTEYLIIKPKMYSTHYYYIHFSNPEVIGKLASRADGTSTSHKRLNPNDFMEQLIIAPPKYIANAFESFAVPCMDLVESLIYKNTILRQTRDLLLPKLISGEIDVSDMDIKIPEETEA